VAREAAEVSTNKSLEAIVRASEINDSATETINSWTKAHQEIVSRAEEASKLAKEAAEASAKASEEAILRAEEVTRSARETAETSIRAAKEATEISKKAAKDAAEISIKVFEGLIHGTGGISNVDQPLSKHIIDIPTGVSKESGHRAEEIDGTISKEMAETLETTPGEEMSEAEDNSSVTKESKEVRQRIENRLESLERMFSSNKASQAEEWDEGEED
jgi:hypothetical protein